MTSRNSLHRDVTYNTIESKTRIDYVKVCTCMYVIHTLARSMITYDYYMQIKDQRPSIFVQIMPIRKNNFCMYAMHVVLKTEATKHWGWFAFTRGSKIGRWTGPCKSCWLRTRLQSLCVIHVLHTARRVYMYLCLKNSKFSFSAFLGHVLSVRFSSAPLQPRGTLCGSSPRRTSPASGCDDSARRVACSALTSQPTTTSRCFCCDRTG